MARCRLRSSFSAVVWASAQRFQPPRADTMAAVSGLPRYLKRPAAAPVALLLIALAVARAAGSAEVVPLARFEVPVPAAAELDPLMARILEALRSGERLSPDDAEDDEAA